MSSTNLDKFKKDFDALAAFAAHLPKPSTDKKDEETEKADATAKALFQAKLFTFQSKYGDEHNIRDLKDQLKTKQASSADSSPTPTELSITAAKIKSLEQIAKLKVDKVSDLRTVLASPYQGIIDGRLEEVHMPQLAGEIPPELLVEVLERTTPSDFGITPPPPLVLRDKQGNPIQCSVIRVSADGKTIVGVEKGRGIALLFSAKGEFVATLLDKARNPIRCNEITVSADGKIVVSSGEDPSEAIAYLFSSQGRLIPLLRWTSRPIDCRKIVVSDDGKTIVAINRSLKASLHNEEGRCTAFLLNEEGKHFSAYPEAVFAKGGIVVVKELDNDHPVHIYDTGGCFIGTLRNENEAIKISFNEEITVASERDIVFIYNANEELTATLQEEKRKSATGSFKSVSTEGKAMLAWSRGDKGYYCTYKVNGEIIRLLNEEGKPIPCFTDVPFSADGKTLVARESDTGIARLYNTQGELIRLPVVCENITVSPDGKIIAATELGTGITRLYSTQELFDQMKKTLPFNELALIRVLESIKKSWETDHPDEPFSTSPIQITCALLEARLTTKDFTQENIKQTAALFKQTYEWVSSALESAKKIEINPQVGTCHDYIKKTYVLQENPPNLGKTSPHMVALAKVGMSLEAKEKKDVEDFHENMFPPTTVWDVLTSWLSPGEGEDD